jgi:hypothetical protein
LGAKIGKNVTFETLPPAETDVLIIEDDCVVMRDSYLG